MTTIIEAYNHALLERKRAKFSIKFGVVLMILLVVFYAVTIAVKGWENDMLIGLIGFAMLGAQAGLRYREYRFWDREVTDFVDAIAAATGWRDPRDLSF